MLGLSGAILGLSNGCGSRHGAILESFWAFVALSWRNATKTIETIVFGNGSCLFGATWGSLGVSWGCPGAFGEALESCGGLTLPGHPGDFWNTRRPAADKGQREAEKSGPEGLRRPARGEVCRGEFQKNIPAWGAGTRQPAMRMARMGYNTLLPHGIVREHRAHFARIQVRTGSIRRF